MQSVSVSDDGGAPVGDDVIKLDQSINQYQATSSNIKQSIKIAQYQSKANCSVCMRVSLYLVYTYAYTIPYSSSCQLCFVSCFEFCSAARGSWTRRSNAPRCCTVCTAVCLCFCGLKVQNLSVAFLVPTSKRSNNQAIKQNRSTSIKSKLSKFVYTYAY